MIAFRNLPIRRKLMWVILTGSLIPLLIAVGIAIAYTWTSLRRQAVSDLQAQAEMLAVSTSASLEFNEPTRATEALTTLQRRPEILAAGLYTPGGMLFASYVRAADVGHFTFPMLGPAGHHFLDGEIELFHSIGTGADIVGHVYLRWDMRPLYQRLSQLAFVLAAGVAGLVGLAFWLANSFQHLVSQPILALLGTAQTVREQRNYSVRAAKFGEDEIGSLTEAFNQMLAGIEERDNALRKLSRAVEQGADNVIITDPHGVIEYVNPAFEALTGYSAAEAIGRKPSLLKSDRHDAKVYKTLWSTVLAGETYRVVVINRKKYGTEYYDEKNITPLKDAQGRITHFVSTGRDITERKRAEEASHRLAAIVQSSADAIISKDAQGIITSWNQAAERLFGYTAAEVIGQPITILIPSDRRAEEIVILDRILGHAVVESYETKRQRKNGSWVDVALTISPVKDANGTFMGTSNIARDITERRQAEERVRASLHEKEVMLQEIHHRVKNNLQVVSSLIGLQLETVKNEEAKTALNESRNRIQTIARVHEHLYQSPDISKLDFASYLRELAVATFHLYQPEHASRVQFAFDVDEIHLDINRAIPCALMVNELLVNALKYAFPGDRRGMIQICLKRLPDNRINLVIRDDGVGLPPGMDWHHTHSLGLDLVQTLARQLRAEVHLDTTSGTAFQITFTATK